MQIKENQPRIVGLINKAQKLHRAISESLSHGSVVYSSTDAQLHHLAGQLQETASLVTRLLSNREVVSK